MDIEYKINTDVTVEQFRDLLRQSTLAERRPVDDLECLAGMLRHSNLIVSAWIDGALVGIARSVTDFTYCCYLSDLAVSEAHQRRSIGIELQRLTQAQLGPRCKLILIAAPAADEYYHKIGFTKNERCWVLQRDEQVAG